MENVFLVLCMVGGAMSTQSADYRQDEFALRSSRGPINHTLTVSDGATIGFWTWQASSQWNSSPTVFMLPTYSVTASKWLSWFGPKFTSALLNVVVIDYRGFGLSVGPWGANTSPDDVSYVGFRASRFAADAHEVMLMLRLERPILLGHSYGNVVAAHLISLFNPYLLGYALLDQSPKLTNIGLPADPTFSGAAVFNLTEQQTRLSDLVSFSAQGEIVQQADYPPRLFNYPQLPGFWNDTFKSIEGLGSDAAPGCCVCYLRQCLRDWAEATSFWSEQNGQVVALTLWDNFNHDWTDVISVIQRRGYPVFVYGGKYSLISVDAMTWVWEKLKGNGHPKNRQLFFMDEYGVHAPWLNPPPTNNYFMNNLTNWASSLQKVNILDVI